MSASKWILDLRCAARESLRWFLTRGFRIKFRARRNPVQSHKFLSVIITPSVPWLGPTPRFLYYGRVPLPPGPLSCTVSVSEAVTLQVTRFCCHSAAWPRATRQRRAIRVGCFYNGNRVGLSSRLFSNLQQLTSPHPALDNTLWGQSRFPFGLCVHD
jgi:hypothetical protein